MVIMRMFMPAKKFNLQKFRIIYLYLFLLVIVLLYGIGSVRRACNYIERDLKYNQKEIVLEENGLRLVFLNGYITMYYKNVQFTENSGFACFFTAKGADYATFKAMWKMEKVSPVELFATVEWPGLPIRQIWHLLLKDGRLNWQIDLESKKDITMINIGAVFFLRNNYQDWTTPYEQGRIPMLEVLQQNKDVRFQVPPSFIGLFANYRGVKHFPAVGLYINSGAFLNRALLSSSRDMFSREIFSSVSLGGKEPLEMLEKSKIYLSSGQIVPFKRKEDLLKYFIMRQDKMKN